MLLDARRPSHPRRAPLALRESPTCRAVRKPPHDARECPPSPKVQAATARAHLRPFACGPWIEAQTSFPCRIDPNPPHKHGEEHQNALRLVQFPASDLQFAPGLGDKRQLPAQPAPARARLASDTRPLPQTAPQAEATTTEKSRAGQSIPRRERQLRRRAATGHSPREHAAFQRRPRELRDHSNGGHIPRKGKRSCGVKLIRSRLSGSRTKKDSSKHALPALLYSQIVLTRHAQPNSRTGTRVDRRRSRPAHPARDAVSGLDP